MTALSILDLSPVPDGSDVGQALRNSADLARHAEGLGYRRYWMAEHHNMPGIASAATAVALAHVAAATKRITIGAGGIMLPNHAPLIIAEQFGTLAALHPGRVELGLGRAPGTDQVAAQAMRRNLAGDVDDFPRDVIELMRYFEPEQPGQSLRAIPGEGQHDPGLDPGVLDLWRAARGDAGPALCLRLAFRAADDDGGDRHLPRKLPSLGPAGQALCHARHPRRRRGHRCRGAVPLSPRSSRPSSTCGAAGPASCRGRSRISTRRSTRAGG